MTELYIFSQDDDLLTVLTESTGLISAPFRDELNSVSNEPFTFTVEADTEKARHVKEENRVVFKDREGKYREFVIKEIDDIDNIDGPETQATCIPAWIDELSSNYVLDKRYTNKEAQLALNDALAGTRYVGIVEVSLGLASTNFYKLTSVDCIWKIRDTWGGDITDEVELTNGRISKRKIMLKQRLGADRGLRFENDHNIEEIQRTVLSYPVTAMYGWGASLETDGGGNTRYIDFADVEWKVANGDPVDKPLGQKWVGDPDALLKYGLKHNGELLHRYGEFSNQNYDNPAELLMATWQSLQQAKKPEINYRLAVDLLDKKAELGDTAVAIDREFSRPIEIQTRIIAIEYDLVDIENTTVVELGQFLSINDDEIYRDIEELKESINKPRPTKPIDNGSYPDIKPGTPTNVTATGAFQTVQLNWDYDSKVYISHYEVYGSQIMDFVPDSQHLLYRGRASGFDHKVNTDEVWYYKIRAVNTRGTPGDFSAQVSASTVRIISDDILFGADLAAKLRDLSQVAAILADDTITFDQLSSAVKDINGTRIKGDLISVDGTTYIANGVIGNLALANGSVTNLKIATGAVDTLQVKDGAITNAKVHDLSADKINAGAIRGIDIYGSKFRSSAGTDWMEIVGGNIKLTQSNGQYVNISPDGIYGYNGSGSVRFRADELLVTSAALGTTYSNAYVAPADGYEVRIVRVNEVPSDGAPGSYVYRPIRTLGVRFGPNANGYIGTDGEVRITSLGFAESGSVIYRPLRAANIYGTAFTTTTTSLWMGTDSAMHVVNKGYVEGSTGSQVYRDIYAAQIRGYSFVTQSANAYIGCDGELRVVNKGLSDIYRSVRALHFYAEGSVIASGNYSAGNNGAFSSSGGYVVVRAASGIVYLQSDYHVRATKPGQASTFVEIRADKFTAQSTIDSKQDITKWTGSALDIINNSIIYQYRKITDVESGITKLRYGYVIGAGYQTPYEVLNHDETGVDQYQMNSLNTKAIQELSELVNINVDDIIWLKLENQLLKQRVDKLEGVA